MFDETELRAVEDEALRQLGTVPVEQLAQARIRRRAGTAPDDPLAASLGRLGVGDPASALIHFRNGRRGPALAWARDFALRFASEIRVQICGAGTLEAAGKAADITAKGAATALASWLAGAFAVSNPIAVAVAALVLMVIGSAIKGAFCAMTSEDVIERLRAA